MSLTGSRHANTGILERTDLCLHVGARQRKVIDGRAEARRRCGVLEEDDARATEPDAIDVVAGAAPRCRTHHRAAACGLRHAKVHLIECQRFTPASVSALTSAPLIPASPPKRCECRRRARWNGRARRIQHHRNRRVMPRKANHVDDAALAELREGSRAYVASLTLWLRCSSVLKSYAASSSSAICCGRRPSATALAMSGLSPPFSASGWCAFHSCRCAQ